MHTSNSDLEPVTRNNTNANSLALHTKTLACLARPGVHSKDKFRAYDMDIGASEGHVNLDGDVAAG